MKRYFLQMEEGGAPYRVGAFFDVDNTLVPGPAIEVRFFHHLRRRGLVGSREAAHSLWYLLRHLPQWSVQPLRERKLYLEGKRPSTIEPLAEGFIQTEIRPRLSKDGVAALEAHQRAGHRVVLLTGSLDFLVAPLAHVLKVRTVLAARPERTNDRYTGQLTAVLPYGEGKRRLVETLAREEGLTLQHSYAYGDSPGDTETLAAVGHPTVVNPIRGMSRIARRNGWKIVTWK